jgi:hypothetical protein
VHRLSPLLLISFLSCGACAPHSAPVTRPAEAAPAAPAALAAPTAPTARLSHLRIHMDRMPLGNVEVVQQTRQEYVGWIRSHGAAVGEVPTYWLRVGADRLWAARPATSWEEIKAQGAQLGRLDEAIKAKVGVAFEANGQRMHAAIDEHHNELLRPIESLTLTSAQSPKLRDAAAVTDLDALTSLRLVAIDRPIPAREDAYLAAVEKINVALRAAQSGLWRAVYFSGLGSGAYVHFIGGERPMKPAELEATIDRALVASVGRAEAERLQDALKASLAQHELVEASLDVERSSLPGATTN